MKFQLFFIIAISLVLGFTSCKSNTKDNGNGSSLAMNSMDSKAKTVNEPQFPNIGDIEFVRLSDLEAKLKEEKRKVIVDVFTDWCGPCKMMDKRTFTDKDIQNIIKEKFYMVKFNAEGSYDIDFKGRTWTNPKFMPNKRGRNAQHELGSFFKVRGYPTLAVLDENLVVVDKIVGFLKPAQLMEKLKGIE